MAIIGVFPATISNGQLIDAVPVMQDFNWIRSQVNANAVGLNDANTYTKLQSGIAATAGVNFPIASQVQNNAFNWCGVAGGTANALTLTPPITSTYAPGQIFWFQAAANNTGPATVAISGQAALPLQIQGVALAGSEITINDWFGCLVDASGTTAQLLSFTSAPTLPIGTNTQQLATMAALAAQAFSAALPNQAGNGGKYVSTNGSVASWQYAGMQIIPVGAATLTDPYSTQAFIANAAYILPDITSSSTFALASLANSPAVPTTVTTSDGWTITPGLAANTFKAVAPLLTPNAHGVWGSVAQKPPVTGTYTAAAAPTLLGTTLLSATLAAVVFGVAGTTSIYAFAVNLTTGASGAPILLSATWDSAAAHIFTDSTTNYVVAYGDTISGPTVIAASVNTGTLVSTPGSPAFGTTVTYRQTIQLAAGLYVHCSGANVAEAFSVSGLVAARGNTLASGIGAVGTIVRVSATTFLMVGTNNGAPSKINAQVGSISGNTVSYPTGAVLGATAILSNQIALFVRALAPGGPFIACFQNNSPGTTGDYYGITVTGTTPTIGTVLALALTLPSLSIPSTYICPPTTDSGSIVMAYSATQLLVGISTGAVALSIAGTTLTGGATFGSASTKFVTDLATGGNTYAVTSSTIDKITVATATITSSYQLAISPIVVASDTMNDKSVNYSANWYTWTLPTMNAGLATSRWLGITGSVINIYGPIS